MEEIAMKNFCTFKTWEIFRNSSRHSGTSRLCYCGWRGLSSENLLNETLPESQSKGDKEKSVFNYRLSQAGRLLENAFGISSRRFQIYQRTLHSLPENAHIIFATCILHNYLRDQSVGLSDMGCSANVRSNFTNIQNQRRRAQQSAFELRDTFKQYFNSPSESVPWQNLKV
jgi:hypothetical protein